MAIAMVTPYVNPLGSRLLWAIQATNSLVNAEALTEKEFVTSVERKRRAKKHGIHIFAAEIQAMF